MASSSSFVFKTLFSFVIVLILTLSASTQYAAAAATAADANSDCYSTIFSFGDSLTDTGNLLHIDRDSDPPHHFGFPPYGETFFDYPTGRCSDGRLIIDFIAEYLGHGLLPPYVDDSGTSANGLNALGGVNFAVVGATALDTIFFEERGIDDPYTQHSLTVQLGWFKNLLPSLCQSPTDCNKFFQRSVFVLGEIGGNDYNHALISFSRSADEILSFVHPVIRAIASAINELISLGALTIIVPGDLPIGCLSAYLTQYASPNKEDYDPETGCLIWINKIPEYHNYLLKIELNKLRELHPQVTIIYADYYNAAMPLYRYPKELGFTGGARRACCGGGGPYNYNQDVQCGNEPATVCEDPSLFVNWDGLHFTEAANRFIAKSLFEGPYTSPHFSTLCNIIIPAAGGTNATTGYSSS